MNDYIKVTNYKQASAYIKYGLKPKDITYTDKIVFWFDKEETQVSGVWEGCKNHELDI